MGSANYNKCITLIKQGGLNHEKELIYLKTNSEGDIPVMAYKFAEGLYIHRLYEGSGSLQIWITGLLPIRAVFL